MALRRGIYIVPTNAWYIERTVWLVAGVVLLAATGLALFAHPLFWLGAEPRLAPLPQRRTAPEADARVPA